MKQKHKSKYFLHENAPFTNICHLTNGTHVDLLQPEPQNPLLLRHLHHTPTRSSVMGTCWRCDLRGLFQVGLLCASRLLPPQPSGSRLPGAPAATPPTIPVTCLLIPHPRAECYLILHNFSLTIHLHIWNRSSVRALIPSVLFPLSTRYFLFSQMVHSLCPLLLPQSGSFFPNNKQVYQKFSILKLLRLHLEQVFKT